VERGGEKRAGRKREKEKRTKKNAQIKSVRDAIQTTNGEKKRKRPAT